MHDFDLHVKETEDGHNSPKAEKLACIDSCSDVHGLV